MNELWQRLETEGVAFRDVAGQSVVEHFGDPAGEYRAVRDSCGVAVRSDLGLVRLWGRDPVKMVNGLITNDLAAAAPGQGVYAVMLTPKGRTVAELRAFRREPASGTEVVLVLPREALVGTREHLTKYVPPMFARWADASETFGVLGVYGPAARRALAEFGGEVPGSEEEGFAELETAGVAVLAARTLEAGGEDGYDLIAPAAALLGLRDSLLAGTAEARRVGFSALETLRIEAGRPRYGAELREETIPTEAFEQSGLMARAISFTKGCYTGQEVIVRIAHRGHVNRHLRGLLLGDSAAPDAGTPLHHPQTGKEIGRTASSTESPLLAQTIALGYVRREVEPGDRVRVGSSEGADAVVVRLPFSSER